MYVDVRVHDFGEVHRVSHVTHDTNLITGYSSTAISVNKGTVTCHTKIQISTYKIGIRCIVMSGRYGRVFHIREFRFHVSKHRA